MPHGAADDGGDLAPRRVGGLGPGAPVRPADDLGARLPRAAPRERHARSQRRRRRRAGDAARPTATCRRSTCTTTGCYVHKADWYRRFEYPVERERGLDFEEDLFTPGELQLDLSGQTEAVIIFSLEPPDETPLSAAALRRQEGERRAALTVGAEDPVERQLRRAADKFVVRRGEQRTIVAGYPWFTDWGRDTFIALPGLMLTTDGVDLARAAAARLGAAGVRRADSQSLPRRRRRARVHLRRRAALVRAGRGARLQARRGCRDHGAPVAGGARRSSTAIAPARASASASTMTAWYTPPRAEWRSPGWTPRSATGW